MIDKRRHYILVLDTETANTIIDKDGKMDMSNVLMYDCGWAVIDIHGNIYETASYVNSDIFIHEKELMASAYYNEKIPQYIEGIKNGSRILANTYVIRMAMLETIKKYSIKEVCAHNSRFDLTSLNNTQRWTTKSKYRYWFPSDTIIWDSMLIAKSVMGKMPTYKKFCKENNYLTKRGQCRFTAEILYRFISKNNDFQERHTALEDCEIEAQIIAYCYRQHKPMKKELFSKK